MGLSTTLVGLGVPLWVWAHTCESGGLSVGLGVLLLV